MVSCSELSSQSSGTETKPNQTAKCQPVQLGSNFEAIGVLPSAAPGADESFDFRELGTKESHGSSVISAHANVILSCVAA